MPAEVRLWSVVDGSLNEVRKSRLDLEQRLEAWLEQDISALSPDLLVIGRQVETAYGGVIDLLCLERSGDAVIVELKRDKTPRDITAQALDYGSWVNDLSHEFLSSLADQYFSSRGTNLRAEFRARFGSPLPEVLNEAHSIVIVGSAIDSSTERIVKYLSSVHGVNINVATFTYYKTNGTELLARVFLLEPSEVENRSRRAADSKRRPNLSPEELIEVATQAGVGELYSRLDTRLSEILHRRTTRSSLAFYARFGNGFKATFSLLPFESSVTSGLRFILYVQRLTEILGRSTAEIQAALPPGHESWKYYPAADQDLSGSAGYFRELSEVERFLALFDGGRQSAGT